MKKKLIELYLRAYVSVFPLMPSEVHKQCREKRRTILECMGKLDDLREDIMSERFYYDFEDPLGHKILEDGEILSQLNTVGEFRKITDRLNTLYNEKEELDQNLTALTDIKNSDKQYSQLNLLSWITGRILDLEAIEDTLLTDCDRCQLRLLRELKGMINNGDFK